MIDIDYQLTHLYPPSHISNLNITIGFIKLLGHHITEANFINNFNKFYLLYNSPCMQ